jgi:hypothetical protein
MISFQHHSLPSFKSLQVVMKTARVMTEYYHYLAGHMILIYTYQKPLLKPRMGDDDKQQKP